jgi:GNAT superfamily N-acetyltransferase
MDQAEFDSWSVDSRDRYARDKMKANGLTSAEAKDIAQKDFDRILPDGLRSKDNYLYCLVSESEVTVGYLWYCLRGAENNRMAWLCEIVLKPEFRGKGYGKSAMQLFEEDVKVKGVGKTGLHVFSFNEPAVKLYKSMGYSTTDLSMQKSL